MRFLRILCSGLLCSSWYPHILYLRTLEKNIVVSLQEEKVNGRTFTYKKECINGQVKKTWFVQGTPVNEHEYEVALIEAEKEESRVRRMKEKEREDYYDQWSLKSQHTIFIKIIGTIVHDIQKILEKVTSSQLVKYYCFDKKHISSRERLDEIEKKIYDTKSDLERTTYEHNFHEYRGLIDLLEKYLHDLEQFYQDSVSSAIKNSDDPKFLQGLLELF